MLTLKYVFFLALVISFTGCSIMNSVVSDIKDEVDFSKYKTFSVLEHPEDFLNGANPLNIPRIVNAIHAEMTIPWIRT